MLQSFGILLEHCNFFSILLEMASGIMSFALNDTELHPK